MRRFTLKACHQVKLGTLSAASLSRAPELWKKPAPIKKPQSVDCGFEEEEGAGPPSGGQRQCTHILRAQILHQQVEFFDDARVVLLAP